MKKLLMTSLLAAGAAMNAQADFLGVYVGAQMWDTDISGDVTPALDTKTDVDGIDKESNTVLYAAFEHPIPFLPNIRLSQADIKFDADGDTIDLSFSDLALYYEVLDNWVSLDLGLAARKYSGEFDTPDFDSGITGELSSDIDATVPMLYARAQFDLPFSGLGIGVDLNTGSSGDDKVQEMNAYLQYETSLGLGFAGGFRQLSAEIETDNKSTADLDIDGPYLSIFYHL